jgi:hypothetical protein
MFKKKLSLKYSKPGHKSLVKLLSLMPNSLSSLVGTIKHLVLSNNDLQDVPTMTLHQLRTTSQSSEMEPFWDSARSPASLSMTTKLVPSIQMLLMASQNKLLVHFSLCLNFI